jgi:hypothetical protein
MDDYTQHAQAVKASVWGYQDRDTDYLDYFRSKFGEAIHYPRTAEAQEYTDYPVREGWSAAEYLAKRWAGYPKTSSRHAHTVTHK